jgi:hypothetical protein
LTGHAHRDRRRGGFNHRDCQGKIQPPIDNPERVVETIFEGDVVCRPQHAAGKPGDRSGVIDVYCRTSPLSRIASADDHEGMQSWCRIPARRSDMDGIDKPVKSIGCSLQARRGDFCQAPRAGRIAYTESIPVPCQDRNCRPWTLPQRSNHLGVPLPI